MKIKFENSFSHNGFFRPEVTSDPQRPRQSTNDMSPFDWILGLPPVILSRAWE